jgi:DinB family protein
VFSARQTARSIDDLLPQFAEVSEKAAAFVSKLTPETILRRPHPASWSVAECFTHLIISADGFFDVWRREIANARGIGKTGEPPFRQDFWGWLLTWSLEPPSRFKMKAPKIIQPISVGPADSILADFLDRQRRIGETMESARGLAIDKIKIPPPVDPRIRYSIWSSFSLNAAHERRHVWQAARAAEALGV